jgi:hypothetical protein
MCTLIVGQEVLAPGTVVLAANRDEDPARPSAGPGVLVVEPRVIGGKDLQAGGTWLALREARAAVAMLNRRPPAELPARDPLRSRGLLALDVAAAAAEREPPSDPVEWVPGAFTQLRRLAGSALGLGGFFTAMAEDREHAFAPFSLVWAAPEGSWAYVHDTAGDRRAAIFPPGWHVMAHDDLDDRREPRVARLLDTLAGWRPTSFEEARSRLAALLGSHGGGEAGGSPAPPVCLHGERAGTVSSAMVLLGQGGPRYLHAPGPPCTHAFEDHTALFAGRS